VLEKGTRAFTAFVRAYKEHQCQFIFRFAKLDLGAMARSYALLRLPRMPELTHHPIPVNIKVPPLSLSLSLYIGPKAQQFKVFRPEPKWPSSSLLQPRWASRFACPDPFFPRSFFVVMWQEFNIDTRGITFKDKAREAARQARLLSQAAEKEAADKQAAEDSKKRGAEELAEEVRFWVKGVDLLGGERVERRRAIKRWKGACSSWRQNGGIWILYVLADGMAGDQDGKRKRKKRKGRHQQIVEEWEELGKVSPWFPCRQDRFLDTTQFRVVSVTWRGLRTEVGWQWDRHAYICVYSN
jgi:hypothetical protein